MFRKVLFPLLAILLGIASIAPAQSPTREPVLIVFYSRFYDHSQPFSTADRLARLLPQLQQLRLKYPAYSVSALLQFSGTVAQVLSEDNPGQHAVDKLSGAAKMGLIELGYTGEDEPSYSWRPRPELLLAETPEDLWKARANAAAKFLNDYKNPVTGRPVEGLNGGLRREQEIFGSAAFISGITSTVGADSSAINELHKLNRTAVLAGIPAADPRFGITGYENAVRTFSTILSPEAGTSPEVYWQDSALRLSSTSLPDNKPHAMDEELPVLKKVLEGLDRSRVRVIKLEIGGYLRYLEKRVDGSVKADPLEWMYFHPDEPIVPANLKSMVDESEILKADKREDAALKWLFEEFLPANPGSRFVSMKELSTFAAEPPAPVTDEQLRELSLDLLSRSVGARAYPANFGKAGGRYFSLAESFRLLAAWLGSASKNGAPERTVAVKNVWGPIQIPREQGPIKGTVTVQQVMDVAARIAPPLSDDAWREVPANMIPSFVEVGGQSVNAAQFLRLMAQASADLSPGRNLTVSAFLMTSTLSFVTPRNTDTRENGLIWTLKPALLHLSEAR